MKPGYFPHSIDKEMGSEELSGIMVGRRDVSFDSSDFFYFSSI